MRGFWLLPLVCACLSPVPSAGVESAARVARWPANRLQSAADVSEAALVSAPPGQRPIGAYTLPPELYRKAHQRGRIGFATRIVAFLYTLVVFWFLLWSGLAAKFREAARKVSRIRFLEALVFTTLLATTIFVLQLPVDLFREHMLKLYAISVQSWRSWFADWSKSLLLTATIGALLCWLLFATIRGSPKRWWFWFWAASLPILLFTVFISPYVIDPLFNRYQPLAVKAPQLVPELQRITRRAGLEVSPERMFWMEASNKTIATNASVEGFGSSKRIIIWDTTLAQESTDEVLMDFGHEMGHYVLGHIWTGFLFAAALLFVLLYAISRSAGGLVARYGGGWGIRGLDDWAALPALLLLLTAYGFAGQAILNTFSRHQESQADIYSLEVARGIVADPGQAAAHSFQLYGETVLQDPDPSPIDVFLFFDHPTVGDRIHRFVTYAPWDHGGQPQFVK